MCMVHTESLDTFTYVHVRTYVVGLGDIPVIR